MNPADSDRSQEASINPVALPQPETTIAYQLPEISQSRPIKIKTDIQNLGNLVVGTSVGLGITGLLLEAAKVDYPAKVAAALGAGGLAVGS